MSSSKSVKNSNISKSILSTFKPQTTCAAGIIVASLVTILVSGYISYNGNFSDKIELIRFLRDTAFLSLFLSILVFFKLIPQEKTNICTSIVPISTEYHSSTVNFLSIEPPTLVLIIGPMFAGKTGEVIKRLRKFKYQSKRCFIIKHKDDTRYNSDQEKYAIKLTTHDKTTFCVDDSKELFTLVYVNKLEEVNLDEVAQYDYVVIEEAHIFGEEWLSFITYIQLTLKKSVIVSTIDSYSPNAENSEPQPIPGLAMAVVLANEVVKILSVCKKCKKESAIFSINHKEMMSGNIGIGGPEKYHTECLQCFRFNTDSLVNSMTTE